MASCNLQTGLTAASYQRYLRGPGKLYRNFTDLTTPGTLLGATKGGTEFSWGMEAFDIQPDGSLGLIKNHRVVNSCKPTMKINLFEHTPNHMLWSVPGGDSDDQTPTGVQGELLNTGAEITDGVGLGGGTVGGAVDESTLSVWYATTGGGVIPDKATLDTDYAMVDTIALASSTTGDEVVVGGTTYTAGTTESLSTNQYDCSGSDTATATSLAACIDSATYGTADVDASSSAGTIYCTRATAGTPTTITEAETTVTLDFQVVLEISAGSIANTDTVSASYTYDSTDSDDAYTVITPGCIESTDYWDNVALVCELSNQSYTNPYIVYIVKNCLPAPDPVTIPGEYPGETVLSMLIEGSFDPADGLTMAYAPVEAWIGIK